MCSETILPLQTPLVASGGFMMFSPDDESSSLSSSSSLDIYLPSHTQFALKHSVPLSTKTMKEVSLQTNNGNFMGFFNGHICSSKVSSSKIKFFASEDVLKRGLSDAVKKKCRSLQSVTFVGTFVMSQPWVENHCHSTSMLQTHSCRGVSLVSLQGVKLRPSTKWMKHLPLN